MFILTTSSLKGYGLNRIFNFAKEAGFEGIEISYNPKEYDTVNADYINSLIKEYDMPVCSIETSANMSSKKIEKTIELAKEVKCRIITIQPPKVLNFKYSTWLKNQVPKIRQKEDISIALQNVGSSTWLGFLPEHTMTSLSELKKFKHACLDVALLYSKKEDPLIAYRSLKNYLVQIRLSNVHRGKEYNLPFNGIYPIESLLTKLKQDNFPGNIAIKVNSKYLKAGNDEKVLENLKKTRKFFDQYFTNQEFNQ